MSARLFTMKTPSIFSILTATALVGIGSSSTFAQVATPPVGFVSIDIPGSSDARISTPLCQASAFQGVVSGISGNTLTVSNAAFTAGQFVQSLPTQTNVYYVRVVDGASAGKWYTITANDATTLTVDSGSAQTLQDQGLQPGTDIGKFHICPHWSLGSLFPNLEGIVQSAEAFAPEGTLILFNNPDTPGTNIAPSITTMYYDGVSGFAPAGWYPAGNVFTAAVTYSPIAPDEHFTIRNVGGQISVTMVGAVPTSKIATELIQRTGAQDNFVTQPFPVPVSPAELKLFESGAFASSANAFAPEGDLLLQFTPGQTGFDLTPPNTYMYYDGVSGFAPAGWYPAGNVFTPAVTSNKIFQPGEALVIRKAAGSDQLFTWTADLPYTIE